MNKKQQDIEELSKRLINLIDRETIDKFVEDEEGNLKEIRTYSVSEIAKSLYNVGYKKVSNDEVVISKEEYESLNKKIAELEQDLIHAGEKVFYKEQNLIIYEDKLKAQVRKETAKEIFHKIKNSYRETGVGILHSTKVYLDTLAEEYNVEI